MLEADLTDTSGTNLKHKTQKSQYDYSCLGERKFIVEKEESYKYSALLLNF